MKCVTTKEHIIEPVLRADRVTGKNHTLPVLSCVVLEVRDGVLSCTATNLEVGVEYSIRVKDAEDGKVAVPGNVLSHILASMQNGAKVTLKDENGFLIIASSDGESKIATQSTDEYPLLPTIKEGVDFSVPAKSLADAISSVLYCTSTSTIKPELSSVFVHLNGTELIAAATDSFRLAEKRVLLKDKVSVDPFLIPMRSAQELIHVLDLADNLVTLTVSEHQLTVTFPDVYVTFRLVSGTFPDYAQIIPKEFITDATFLIVDIERVLKKASVFSDKFNQTTLKICPKNKTFTIHTEHSGVGESTDSVSAALSGEEVEIRFNQRYLSESFRSIHTDSATIQFSGQAQPAVVRPVGDTSFLYLVMPMNR